MARQYPNSYYRAYPEKGKTACLSETTSQIALLNARAYNNTGGAISVGIVRKIAAGAAAHPQFRVWSFVAAGSVYTDVTALVAAGTNIFTATDNDGFLIQSTHPFGLVGMTVSTAGAGGTFTYKYSSSATAFTTLTKIDSFDCTGTGDTYCAFRPPTAWALAGNAGLDQTMYTVQVIATTAPGGVVAINSLWVGEFLELVSGVADKSGIEVSFPDSKPFLLQAGEGVMPYFSTANAANAFGAYYASV